MTVTETTNDTNDTTDPEGKEPRAVRKARVEVARLRRAELELAATRLTLADELDGATARAGSSMLAAALDSGAPPKSAIDWPAQLALEIEATDGAIVEARSRRRAAVRDLFAAQAEVLKADARGKRREASKRRERTDRLLAELAEHEGATFEPARVFADAGSRLGHAMPTRTELLEGEARELEQKAQALSSKPVPAHATLEGGSPDELLAALWDLDATVVGPTIGALVAWCAAQEGKLAKQAEKLERDGASTLRRYRVIFARSEIAPESTAQVRLVERRVEAGDVDELVALVAAATGGLDDRAERQLRSRVDRQMGNEAYRKARAAKAERLTEGDGAERRLVLSVTWEGTDPLTGVVAAELVKVA